jgi:N-formylglutamate amidohydrolase
LVHHTLRTSHSRECISLLAGFRQMFFPQHFHWIPMLRKFANPLSTTLALTVILSAGCGGSSPSGPSDGPVLSRLGGDEQTGTAGSMLGLPVRVQLKNSSRAAVSGTTVVFTIDAGGGAMTDTLVVTNAQGIASTTWYLGPAADVTNRIRATTGSQSVQFSAQSIAPVVGLSYFGAEQYMEYLPGNLPIIISAPHGGTVTPASIPDRTVGEDALDTFTQELAREIRSAFFERTGRMPHVIICRIRRTKLDANREIVEAAQGNRQAQRAWFEYHSFIETAKSRLNADHPRGFYMDLHGHGHPIARLELGYMLTTTQLNGTDNALAALAASSSIRSLVQTSGSNLPQLVRGPFSLGTLFEAEGFPAVPSASQPSPGTDPYFNGGYNTNRHGSRNGGTISGFQLEANFTGVRDTPGSRANFADALVDVYIEYFARHFGVDLLSSPSSGNFMMRQTAAVPAQAGFRGF